MAPFFESLLSALVRGGEDHRVTLVTSLGEPTPNGSTELDWKSLPETWHLQTAPDDDALLAAAKSEAKRSDELVVLARWGTASDSFRVLDHAAGSWLLPEIAACEVAPELPNAGRVAIVVP